MEAGLCVSRKALNKKTAALGRRRAPPFLLTPRHREEEAPVYVWPCGRIRCDSIREEEDAAA